ncbi:MAG: hypothetical protein Q8N88_03145 [Nanoarchaeota archaeon]|nr:hypothetical protein [Nanoarchaeota archaeon]
MLNLFASLGIESKLFVKPETYVLSRLSLHKDFLKEHPIEEKPLTKWEQIRGLWRRN